jgi:hypothetical protein
MRDFYGRDKMHYMVSHAMYEHDLSIYMTVISTFKNACIILLCFSQK